MSLRAIIIDDEQKGINALKMLIEKCLNSVKIVAQCTNASHGIESIENYKPEIVFLDIHMPGMNGFELLEKLRWKEFSLVFTTAHQEYGLKALKNNAVDYLLKPIGPEDLKFAIDKIISQRAKNENAIQTFSNVDLPEAITTNFRQRIILNTRSGAELVDLNEIVCMESTSNYTTVFLDDERKILVSKSLKELDQQLCTTDQRFMRIHQSFIINLDKVSRYLKTSDCIIMCRDQKVPVAKSKKERFFKWLNP